jgi:glutathione S-transferase
MAIEVYGRRNSLNVQKVMWALGELGLDYRRYDVGGSFGYPDEYGALNPNPLVPALVDGEVRMWESNACVRYLARTYGQGSLWPDDPPVLARADQWMDWQATRLGPAFLPAFIQLIRMPADKRNPQAIDAGLESAAALYRVLDRQLGEHPFVAGRSLTMGDIAFGPMTYRYFEMDIERPELPSVQAWFERLGGREAFRYHAMIPFGRNPEEWQREEARNAGVQ